MGFFHKGGTFIGDSLGFLLGEPVKYAGKRLDSALLQEIGQGVKDTSSFTFSNASCLVDGAWNTASGYIKQDENLRQQGMDDVFESIHRTGEGIGNTFTSTVQNGRDVVGGFAQKDYERLYQGTEGIVKTVSVGAVAVTVFDFVNGSEGSSSPHGDDTPQNTAVAQESYVDGSQTNAIEIDQQSYMLDTINSDITVHEETGVPFERHTVELPNGDSVTGMFPDFNEVMSVSIDEDMYLESDYLQFEAANSVLANQLEQNPELKATFTEEQIAQIQMGETPDNYVWHHNETPGRLELVDEETHANTGHTGGRFIWGGGTDYR